jgi:biotin/lipoate A/B protein ligase family protein
MSLGARSRIRTPYAAALDLPPPFSAVMLREAGDAFAHAVEIAPEAGAGTLVWVGRFDLVEFALIVEPDELLVQARRTFYAGMVALVDALLVHAPAEKLLALDWPDAIFIDGGLVGGARMAWPSGAAEDAPPDWLVFGAMIRTVTMGGGDPGLRPFAAALEEEGFDDVGSGRLVESFARHFMTALDGWNEVGFATVARNYLQWLPTEKGVRHDIDENGDLLVRRMGKTDIERRPLIKKLADVAWLDPQTRGPRL